MTLLPATDITLSVGPQSQVGGPPDLLSVPDRVAVNVRCRKEFEAHCQYRVQSEYVYPYLGPPPAPT